MRGGVLALGLLAAGCAGAPVMPPLLDLGARGCAGAADLARAVAVPGEGKASVATIDAASPCLGAGTERSLYAVFRLPEPAGAEILEVRSLAGGGGRGGAVLPPRLTLLTETGGSRTVGFESFVFRGSALQASVRLRAGERHVVVSSDPAVVGRQEDRIDSVHIAYPVGPYTTAFQGAEVKNGLTYSHAGTVAVATRPVPR